MLTTLFEISLGIFLIAFDLVIVCCAVKLFYKLFMED